MVTFLSFAPDSDCIKDRNPQLSELCPKTREFKVEHAMADGTVYLVDYGGGGGACCSGF